MRLKKIAITIDKATTLILSLMLLILIISSIGLIAINEKLLVTIFIVFTLFLLLMIMQHKGLTTKQITLFIPYIFFIIIYIVNLIAYPTVSAVNNIIMYLAFGLFLLLILSVLWKRDHLRWFSSLSLVILAILLLIIFLNNININPNTIAILAYILWFFPFLYFIEHKTKYAKIKISLLTIFVGTILYLSGTRSVILAVAFMILTYSLWGIISKHKFLFNLYFISVMIFIIGFTIVYPHLDTILYNFYDYQDIVCLYTGKRLYSGRQEIWGVLLYYLKQKPFLGYGSGALTSEFIHADLSAHNLYLEIAIQVGIIGLFFLLFFLFNIWKIFWMNRHDKKVILCACFFIGILIHQMFEVLLIKADIAIDLLMWLLIGIGLSSCMNSKNESPKKN